MTETLLTAAILTPLVVGSILGCEYLRARIHQASAKRIMEFSEAAHQRQRAELMETLAPLHALRPSATAVNLRPVS